MCEGVNNYNYSYNYSYNVFCSKPADGPSAGKLNRPGGAIIGIPGAIPCGGLLLFLHFLVYVSKKQSGLNALQAVSFSSFNLHFASSNSSAEGG